VLALILALLALMSFLMMLVTLLIGVKLANELAAAEQAMSERAAVLIPITSHAPSRPHSSGPLPLAGRVFSCLRPVRCLMEE
jgi:hypothetical protein